MRLVNRPDGSTPSQTYAQVARANPWIMASLIRRANPAATVELQVHRPVGDRGQTEKVSPGDTGVGGDLARLLQNPDAGISGRRWRAQILTDRLVQGNATVQKLYTGSSLDTLRWRPFAEAKTAWTPDGLRVEAWSWPSTRTPWGSKASPLPLMPGGDNVTSDALDVASARDVIHITASEDTESPLGLSPLAPLHYTHALHDAVMRFAVAFLDNGLYPSGAIELPANATPDQATVARELITELYSGADRAGKPYVGFGKWQQISSTPDAARLIDLAELSREEVAAAYDVPLSSLSSSVSNRAQSQTDRQRFVRDVIGGDVDALVAELQTQLVDADPTWSAAGLTIKPNMWDLMRPDSVALAAVIATEVGGPVATPNEGRKWVGLPPLDDEMADRLILNPGTPGAGGAEPTDDGTSDGDDAAADV